MERWKSSSKLMHFGIWFLLSIQINWLSEQKQDDLIRTQSASSPFAKYSTTDHPVCATFCHNRISLHVLFVDIIPHNTTTLVWNPVFWIEVRPEVILQLSTCLSVPEQSSYPTDQNLPFLLVTSITLFPSQCIISTWSRALRGERGWSSISVVYGTYDGAPQ
jgi:hypothetical protein